MTQKPRKNHWQIKRFAKFACKEHGSEYLQAGCQKCIDGFNAFMDAEMKRKIQPKWICIPATLKKGDRR